MAFITADLVLQNSANGYNYYRYDTLDTHATVDAAGYFNNADDDQVFQVGDIIDVIVWLTATRTGTISTYGRHLCNEVTAAGAVDVTNVTVGTVTDDR
jgi:hypothetical protein